MTPKRSVRKPPGHAASRGGCVGGRERPDQAVPGQGLSREVGGAGAGGPAWLLVRGLHVWPPRPLRAAAWASSQRGGHRPRVRGRGKPGRSHTASGTRPWVSRPIVSTASYWSRGVPFEVGGLREGVKLRGDRRAHLGPAAAQACPPLRPGARVLLRDPRSVARCCLRPRGSQRQPGVGGLGRGHAGGRAGHAERTQSPGRGGSPGPGARPRRDAHTGPRGVWETQRVCGRAPEAFLDSLPRRTVGTRGQAHGGTSG